MTQSDTAESSQHTSRSKRADTTALIAAAVAGAAVWALSPSVTGKPEPWDADTPYLSIALACAGLALGLVQPGRAAQHWLGIVLGQLAWEVAFLPVGPLIVVGVFFLAFWSLLTLLASLLGSLIRRVFSTPVGAVADRLPRRRVLRK